MIPLIKEFLHNLLYSRERATLWLRGTWFTAWQLVSVLATQGMLGPIQKWAPVISAVSGLALFAKAGDRNVTPPVDDLPKPG